MHCRFRLLPPQLVVPAMGGTCRRNHARLPVFSNLHMRNSGNTDGGRLVAPETLWLFAGEQPTTDSGNLQPMLDTVWTLQYQIPGAICGFAGEITTSEGLSGVALDGFEHPHLSGLALLFTDGLTVCCAMFADDLSAGFTHAVHLRFAQPRGMNAFSSNARLQQTLGMEAHPLCSSIFQVGFEVRHPDACLSQPRVRCVSACFAALLTF